MNVRGFVSWGLVSLLCLQSTLQPVLAEPPLLDKLKRLGKRQGHPPATSKDRAIEELAANLDWLEHELDEWGTVVPKVPDVWGEARLTQYRREVEQQLAAEIGEFDEGRINAAQLVSDQAFLAAALSMNLRPPLGSGTAVATPQVTATVSGGTAGVPGGPAEASPASARVAISGQTVQTVFGTKDDFKIGSVIKLEQTEELNQRRAYLDHLNALRRTNEGDDASDAPGYSLNLVRIPISILPGTQTRKGYGAEITITAVPQFGPEMLPFAYRDFVINDLVDQLAVPFTRYVNDAPVSSRELLQAFVDSERLSQSLSAIRTELLQIAERFNCASDAEACALLTQANSVLFRDGAFDALAISQLSSNDLAIELENLVAPFVEVRSYAQMNPPIVLAPQGDAMYMEMASPNMSGISRGRPSSATPFRSPNATERGEREFDSFDAGSAPIPLETIRQWLNQRSSNETQSSTNAPEEVVPSPDDSSSSRKGNVRFASSVAAPPTDTSNSGLWALQQTEWIQRRLSNLSTDFSRINMQLESFRERIEPSYIPTSQGRRSTLPFPSTHFDIVYGLHGLAHLATTANQAFARDVINNQVIHITDVQALMRSELMAACDLMALDIMQPVWMSESTGERVLYRAIRSGDRQTIENIRNQFLTYVGPHAEHFHTAYFAWAVYVESILLNERLLEDMRQTVSPNGSTMAPPCWIAFFGPQPSEEACSAFAEYVKVRWPIKVFTVDPAVLEQNVADVSTVYREMQLAIALSVAGGQMSTSAALNTLRKIQRDMATVDLNRTVVGFSHGADTFGWRFYPRFQTPPVEGNLTVFFRDLVAGGPTDDQLERAKQIEPGIRECIALVLMPSFVSNITFDSRGNWFKLTRPGHTAQSISENVEYSRSIEAMRNNAMQCTQCAQLYRPGELDRLLRRVDQLDRELPLQTLACQLPIENTLGGFEIFTSGTRELAPELLGWYGAPGYDPVNGSTFFLAGDNFSIHQTSVIAGNRPIEVEKMLSRQVIQVTLPPHLPVIPHQELRGMPNSQYQGYVDVHLSTPYGVSGHLLVPAVAPAGPPPVASALQFRNGFFRYSGTVKVVPDPNAPNDASKAEYSVVELQIVANGPLYVQLPKLRYSATSGVIKTSIFQQTPSNTLELLSTQPADLTAVLDTDKSLLASGRDLTALTSQLKSVLNTLVDRHKVSTARLVLVLQAKATVGSQLNEEPIVGAIPIDIELVTHAQ